MFKNHIVTAFRNIQKNKTYAVINVLGLGLGMTCSILIFLYVQKELSYDQYHKHADRIYRLVGDTDAKTAPAFGPALTKVFPEVQNFVRLRPPGAVWLMQYADQIFYEDRVYWSDNTIFDVFSFDFIQGDPQTALQRPFSMVINERTAQKYFGDENPLGRIITTEDFDAQITGIIKNQPPNSHFTADFFISMSTLKEAYKADFLSHWFDNSYYTYLLLSENHVLEDLVEKFPDFIEIQIGDQLLENGQRVSLHLQHLPDIYLHSNLENEAESTTDIRYIYVLCIIGVFVILIAYINYVNLATARSITRFKELGIRKAIGANRFQLFYQFLTESILLSTIALLCSMALVFLLALVDIEMLDGVWDVTDELHYLLPMVIILTTGLIASAYPALYLSSFNPVDVIKGKTNREDRRALLRKGLVVTQFTISVSIVIGTYIIHSQLSYVQDKNLGFNKEQVLVLPLIGNQTMNQRYDRLKDEYLKHPNVVGVTRSWSMPGRQPGRGDFEKKLIQLDGTGPVDSREMLTISVDFDFFKTLDISFLAGRTFSKSVSTDVDGATIVNAMAVDRLGLLSPEEALGKQMKFWDTWYTIICVVDDFHITSLHRPILPLAIDMGDGDHIAIRVNPNQMLDTIGFLQEKWEEISPGWPFRYTFLNDDFDRLYRVENAISRYFSLFSVLTIFISCLGLFGLSSFVLEQRTKEIAIRKVLGASATTVYRLLTQDILFLILVANLISWPFVYIAMENWLQSYAYRMEIKAVPFLVGGVINIIVAAISINYQLIKVIRRNPVQDLS